MTHVKVLMSHDFFVAIRNSSVMDSRKKIVDFNKDVDFVEFVDFIDFGICLREYSFLKMSTKLNQITYKSSNCKNKREKNAFQRAREKFFYLGLLSNKSIKSTKSKLAR